MDREKLLEDYKRAVIRRHLAHYEDLRRARNRRDRMTRRVWRLSRFAASVALTVVNIVRWAA
jgi:hypothetical protein